MRRNNIDTFVRIQVQGRSTIATSGKITTPGDIDDGFAFERVGESTT
ncbi:MAG: hypothetical protein ACJ8KF_03805 [Chthoniobacterales bacterium]|jgi:hypothetical protein